ncbi:MAG: PaaI family thioesterase [Bdellovibrionota bacterium]
MIQMTSNKGHTPDSKRFGLENYSHPDHFGKWLGYEVLNVDRSSHQAEVELKIREEHLSPAGKVHGGVVSAFFDFACGAAVFSTLETRDFCSTVELKVNYFYPLVLGDRLVAKTRVVFRGKKLCVVHGFLYRGGEEKEVAMCTATFNIVSAKV